MIGDGAVADADADADAGGRWLYFQIVNQLNLIIFIENTNTKFVVVFYTF